MNATIKQVKDALADGLSPILTTAGVQEFLTYRTLKATAGVIAMLSNAGNMTEPGSTGENGAIYNYNLYVLARYENTTASQETAENILDAVETAVMESGLSLESNYWRDIQYRQASTRPASPAEYVGWRWMEIYLRVFLR